MVDPEPTNIDQNNKFDIILEGQIVAVQSTSPEDQVISQSNTVVDKKNADNNNITIHANSDRLKDVTKQTSNQFFHKTLKEYNETQAAALQKKQQQSAALQKQETPNYNVTLEQKNAFSNELKDLFQTKENLQKITIGKKKVDSQETTKYKKLRDILLSIKKNTNYPILSTSIRYDMSTLVSFKYTNTQKPLTKEERDENNKIDKNKKNYDPEISFGIIIKKILEHKELEAFKTLLRKKTANGTFYEKILYNLIYRPNENDDTLLKEALILSIPTNGGKIKTQKNRINKLKTKNTRSIKRSKKNITRRR